VTSLDKTQIQGGWYNAEAGTGRRWKDTFYSFWLL